MSTSRWLRVGGTRVTEIGKPGSLKWSHSIAGGSEQASWDMDLPQSFSHPALRLGAQVQILSGPGVIWGGVLDEPDRTGTDGISFSAAGYATEAREYLCFDGSLNTTSVPDTAIDQAIARGLNKYGITRPTSISAVAFALGDETDSLNILGDLLDEHATSDGGKRWGIDPAGRFYKAADPTTPSLHLRAGSAKVGFAGDDYASDVYLRYKTSAAGYATEHATDAFASSVQRRERPVDGTNAGVITGAKATALAQGEMTQGRARYAFTAPITVAAHQLTTPGGQPVSLDWVAAGGPVGLMVRQFDVVSEQGAPLAYLDWVVGRTEVEDGAATMVLSPVNLATRTLGDALAVA